MGNTVRYPSSGGSGSSPTTMVGDLITRGASEDERLAIGNLYKILESGSSIPRWGDGIGVHGGWKRTGAYVNLDGSIYNSWGSCAGASATDASSGSGTTDGWHMSQTSATTADAQARVFAGSGMNTPAENPTVVIKFGLGQTGNTRFFAGLTDSINCIGSTGALTRRIGIGFDAFNSDTNFFWETADNTTLTRSNVAVAASTSTYTVVIEVTQNTSVTFYLYNSSLTLLASHTATATMPAVSTGMGVFSGVNNEASGEAKVIRNYTGSCYLRQ